MRPLRLIPLLVLLATGVSALAGTTVEDSILSGGIYRKYRLYIPSSYTGAQNVPLVLNLHGFSTDALQHQYYASFMGVADTAGFLVLHPQGTGQNPYWNAGLSGSPNDVQFIGALMDTIMAGYKVDADRVYCAGFSSGAIMSYYLACQLPSRFAAIASVAGTMLNNWSFGCNPNRAYPVMLIHGTSDNTVTYSGSGLYAPVDSVKMKWVRHNNCVRSPSGTAVPDTSNSDFSTATHYVHDQGVDGSSVELYKVQNGGHSWPGASVYIDLTNKDFGASVEIWRFFRKYRISQFTTKVALREDAEDRIRIASPVGDRIALGGPVRVAYEIVALDGKSVMSGTVDGNTIDVSRLPGGIYFLRAGNDPKAIRFVKLSR
jgi:polyhydroxybutyrate depolymerase